jgi:hypothetical protein
MRPRLRVLDGGGVRGRADREDRKYWRGPVYVTVLIVVLFFLFWDLYRSVTGPREDPTFPTPTVQTTP